MSEQSFRMKHGRTIRQHETSGAAVVVTVQTVGGTAWQKTAYRVTQKAKAGAKRIVVMTNRENPVIEKVGELVGDLNLLLSGVTVIMEVYSLRD